MNKVFDYSVGVVPPNYRCANCGVTDIKLWRQYQTFDPQLLCCDCAAKDQKENIADIDGNGMWTSHYKLTPQKIDQIGWYVPAIPDEEGVGYWGYTSVPDEGIAWWRKLPTRKT